MIIPPLQGVVCKYPAVEWSTPIACGIMHAWLYMLICTCIKAHLPAVLASCCNLSRIQLLTHSNLPLLSTAACIESLSPEWYPPTSSCVLPLYLLSSTASMQSVSLIPRPFIINISHINSLGMRLVVGRTCWLWEKSWQNFMAWKYHQWCQVHVKDKTQNLWQIREGWIQTVNHYFPCSKIVDDILVYIIN